MESKEFIEALKKQWLAMIDAIDDPLVIVDRNFHVLRQNKAYYEQSFEHESLSLKKMAGTFCYKIFGHRSEPCSHCRLLEALSSFKNISWKVLDWHNHKHYVIHVYPLDEYSAVVHYKDVTSTDFLHEQLTQADKLSALGKLAGGVAHEINSPIAGILAFSQILLKEMPEEEVHRKDILEIEAAARKCKAIVEGLLNFARQEKAHYCQLVKPSEGLEATLRLAGPLLRKHAVDVDLEDTSLYGVSVNKIQLEQVFLNLITNAIYAMKENGGLLSIKIYDKYPSVVIDVQDTGTGIEPEHASRIFDPFFTTKPIGEGTGLGLSISYSLIKQYEGDILLVSSSENGALFRILLPARKLISEQSETH